MGIRYQDGGRYGLSAREIHQHNVEIRRYSHHGAQAFLALATLLSTLGLLAVFFLTG